jgi:hypothetical protein
MHAYLDMCFDQWYLHQRGLISSKLWSLWHSGMEAGFSRPALQQAWLIVRAEKKCDKDFLLFIERSVSSAVPAKHTVAGVAPLVDLVPSREQ